MAAGVLGMTRRRAGRPCAPASQPRRVSQVRPAAMDTTACPSPRAGTSSESTPSIIWGLTHRKTYSAWAAATRLSSATAHPSSAARAVGDNHLLRPHGPARRLNQRRAHVSRSDKCRFFHPAPPFRIVCNQCFLFRPPVLFDGRLPPEGRPLVGTRLPVDHRQRSPAPGILGPPPPAVGRQTPLHIGGGAGVEGSVPAAEDINPPAHGLTTPAAARAAAPAPGTPPLRRSRTRRCPVPSGWPWRAAGCPRTGG